MRKMHYTQRTVFCVYLQIILAIKRFYELLIYKNIIININIKQNPYEHRIIQIVSC